MSHPSGLDTILSAALAMGRLLPLLLPSLSVYVSALLSRDISVSFLMPSCIAFLPFLHHNLLLSSLCGSLSYSPALEKANVFLIIHHEKRVMRSLFT